MSIFSIASDFEVLDDWEDKYRYVIELGRALPPFPEPARTDANKVRGCASQVWLLTEIDPATKVMTFRGDSDAHIVKGLIAILLTLLSGKTSAEILSADPMAEFAKLGLAEHLTPQRSNGLASMVARIKADASLLAAGDSRSGGRPPAAGPT
jgi:cysteine desulfuration protein SufE